MALCMWRKTLLSSSTLVLLLMQVVSSPDLGRSGVYWSWNNKNGSFENDLSEESSNQEKARKLWDLSMKLVGLD